jgi:two-component system response regulator RegX3
MIGIDRAGAWMRILIVEDDDHVGDALELALRQHGHDVSRARTGAEALAAVDSTEFVLLDMGLPDLDGVEVCRRIRERSTMPLIAVTARGEEIDRVTGLRTGADDYIVKPFGTHELLARIEAVTRRTKQVPATQGNGSNSGVLRVGSLQADVRAREVTLDGNRVEVTRKEFDLLVMLAEEPDKVHTRESIIGRVWDEHWFGSTRTLDVHVGALRTKLGGYHWVETVRGVGFRLGRSASS